MSTNPPQGAVKADPRVVRMKRAALIYCQKTNADPNAIISAPHETLAGVMVQIPVWYAIAERLLGLQYMLRSIKEANDQMMAEQQTQPAVVQPAANEPEPAKGA